MEIWDDLIKQLTLAADQTIKEAEKLTSSAKLKFNISEEEHKLRSLYALLGKRYYEKMKDSDDIPEEYRAAFEEISAKLENIEKLNADQAEVKNCRVCPGCKAKIAKDAPYCQSCGLKQNKEETN